MAKYIFSVLFLILALDSYSQNKNIIFTRVILSNSVNTINNNDTIAGPESKILSISIASDNYHLKEAEYSITIKRGKANVYTMSGKGKEISLIASGAYSQSKDILMIEIKKLIISTPGVILKPSNGLFKIYLK